MLLLGGSGDTQVSEQLLPRDSKVPHGENKAKKCKLKVRRQLVSQSMDILFLAWQNTCSASCVLFLSWQNSSVSLNSTQERVTQGQSLPRNLWKRKITSSKADFSFVQKRDSKAVGFRHHGSGLISAPGRTEGWEILLPKANWRQNVFVKSFGLWNEHLKKNILIFWPAFLESLLRRRKGSCSSWVVYIDLSKRPWIFTLGTETIPRGDTSVLQ